jgi:uncharacterized protein (TIGR03083 family)
MSEWNFMHADSKANLLRVVGQEAEKFFDLVSQPGCWEAPTAAGQWQVRDQVGHLVDTTEGYFRSFDAARGNGTAPEPLGVRDMAGYVDEGARSFRTVPQDELVDRLRTDYQKMRGIFDGLTDDEWTGLIVPHKYMGPLPAGFYASFQLVDYTVHSWDIRQGAGNNHGLEGDAADFLVPLAFIVWSATAVVDADTEPFDIGIRLTGRNGGETRGRITKGGLTFSPEPIDDVPATVEFDPASFVLTCYGRINGGTWRGDASLADRFRNLFFRI